MFLIDISKHFTESYLPILYYLTLFLIFDIKMDDYIKQIHFHQKKMLKNKYKNYDAYIPKLVTGNWDYFTILSI